MAWPPLPSKAFTTATAAPWMDGKYYITRHRLRRGRPAACSYLLEDGYWSDEQDEGGTLPPRTIFFSSQQDAFEAAGEGFN